MCTMVILRRPAEARWPLIIAANRDEMQARPWEPPARHWPDRASVTAGLDVTASGTWLGISDRGLIAGVLNRPGSLGGAADKRSRGELPLEALDHATAGDAADALLHLDPAGFRAFNLFVADANAAFWLKSTGRTIAAFPVPEGVSLLTAHGLNDAASARTRRYRPLFTALAPPDPDVEGGWAAWADLMGGRETDPDGGPEGAMRIETGEGFATVSSSLMALPRPAPNARPRWLFCPGAPGTHPYLPVFP